MEGKCPHRRPTGIRAVHGYWVSSRPPPRFSHCTVLPEPGRRRRRRDKLSHAIRGRVRQANVSGTAPLTPGIA